ncbi:MAG TPA: peroxidase family protein, partial [Ornithinibacter sp.]|nr:peroxidase family protein [Ornithinibacter sp.]
HAICGDGRCNENIALQAVHQVFHDEHDRLIDDIKNTLTLDADASAKGAAALAEWKLALGADGWNGQRLFQAARFVTEMQYQHLVFEEFARKVQPAINPFEPFAFTQTDVNPAITAEFAHAVYRFGHSMLTDSIPRVNTDGSHNDIKLLDGFLNPAAYYQNGSQTLSSADAAGSIIMGLSDQTGQEIDEFVVDTLRNNLLGLPLDLPSLNMARARSEGIPPLNDVRRQIFGQTNDGQLKPYTDWIDFGQQLKHPESLVNFVAAYGTHTAITSQTTTAGRRTAADRIVNGTVLPGPDGIVGADPSTALDDTAAVPAGPGPDGSFGTDCDTATPSPECADNTAAVPADPGADGILGPNPATALDDIAPPADSADFMFGTGSWSNSAGKTTTGVDNIDLWVGGLAERTNLFGGLLGSTFNYVFENQLTNLQNGDRFYYLARTPGMNLRAQLEGNSFSELVMRNTPAHTLKADPFATADCKFELSHLTSPATSVGSSGKLITGAGSVQDDPTSECDENEQLLRMGDGTWRYRMTNTAMPSGINAQAVYNGSPGNVGDKVWGGADNDTFWGGPGSDTIEGGDGADIALGGEGNDIITDLAGDDVPKGGPGNDAIDAGPGLDIIMAGDGHDFTNGGANSNEHFMGAGDDFAIGGQGIDAIFGDSGDDWEEGGDQPDLLIGDSSSFFFDDHNVPGHDILIGQGGDDDYDLEGGDDIGVAGPGVEKVAGAAGYDWEIGLGDPQPQDTDLAQVFVAGGVILPGVRDKFNEVEALSGGALNDTLRGDDVVPTAVGGGGFVGCDALDAAGVARIKGLDTLITPEMRTVDPAATGGIFANTSTHQCLLEGNVWGAGNILLGGAGNDLIEGRGADDIIDGDRYVNVRLSVRTDRTNPASEIGSTDLMTGVAKTGNFGAGTSGMTLQQAVFAGKLDPGNIVAVREILTSATPDTDVAVFSDVRTSYEITVADVAGEKVITVNHTGGTATDGIDTLRNVETLRFVGGDVATSTIIAPVAAAELSTTALVFGLRATGSSTTLPVVVTNNGNANLTVTGATIAPASGTGFSVASNGCTTPLVPLDTCTIQVAFAPGGSTAAQTATLNIASNAPGSPTTVSLTGQGQTAPSIQVATTLAFGLRATGSTTNLPLVVTNNGSAPLVVSGVTLNPATGSGFTIATNACSTVAPGATCTITVAFAPGASTAVRTATLNIAHNAAGTPTAVTLTGQGQAPAAQAVITLPATTDFGLRRVGTVRTQSVRLANTGNAPLTIGTFTTTGAFTVTRGNCPAAPATLAAGRSCNLSVSFQPTGTGPATGTLTVTGNAANSPRTAALTGTGR